MKAAQQPVNLFLQVYHYTDAFTQTDQDLTNLRTGLKTVKVYFRSILLRSVTTCTDLIFRTPS